MIDPRTLVKEVATNALAGSRYRRYKFNIYNGEVKHNMLGGEVDPAATKGVILSKEGGWYVQKVGPTQFAVHLESLIPEALNVGDKVEIKHAGFAGLAEKKGEEGAAGEGLFFRTITLSRSRLEAPGETPHPVLKDMTEQLSEMRLPDGRRGLHMLADLKFANFRGDGSDTLNPYLEFEVEGAKFIGTVRIEYIWGRDTYDLHFIKGDDKHVIEDVHFDQTVPFIENHCDSSQARLAKVTIISRAKAPKTPKAPAPAAQLD